MAIDSQVCFHRWLFYNPVKPCQCITGPVGPLGSTNQNWLGAKLLPMAVSILLADCTSKLASCYIASHGIYFLFVDSISQQPSLIVDQLQSVPSTSQQQPEECCTNTAANHQQPSQTLALQPQLTSPVSHQQLEPGNTSIH